MARSVQHLLQQASLALMTPLPAGCTASALAALRSAAGGVGNSAALSAASSAPRSSSSSVARRWFSGSSTPSTSSSTPAGASRVRSSGSSSSSGSSTPGPSTSTAAAATRGATGASSSSASASSLTPSSRWLRDFKSAPAAAKLLGFAGVIPFVALAPPVAKHLYGLLPPDIMHNSAMWQVGYGASILSFLGAVHWGAAMASPLTGPIAARIASERFIWSVVPSLAAWPLTVMEPAPASLVLAFMLPAVYIADASFARRGYLPVWYMALRAPLTLGATFGMLLTATYYVHEEYDRIDRHRAAKEAASASQA